jgi:hypothetical protein
MGGGRRRRGCGSGLPPRRAPARRAYCQVRSVKDLTLRVATCFSVTMSDSFSTQYIKGGFAASDDVLLSQTARTRIVFHPGVHGGGVRGQIVRQKIGANGTWAEVNEVDFRSLPADCGVSIELDTEATQRLHESISRLYEIQRQGVASGSQQYIVAPADSVVAINDRNRATAIQELLNQGYSEEFWLALAESNPDLAARLAVAKIQLDRLNAVRQFEASLVDHADDEAYWQRFFEDHPWMLQAAFPAAVYKLSGETYLGGKMPVGRQGKGGVATDFLFADDSTKSFAVVEIKTPGAGLVGPRYRGEADTSFDNETYSMHSDLSGSVVQVRNQIAVAVEDFRSVLGRSYEELSRIHPRGVLIIGTVATLNQRERDSFNLFRYTLYGLTVITYDELLTRLKFDLEGVPEGGPFSR